MGGGAALGATLGFIVGSIVHDFRRRSIPTMGAHGRLLGGILGLAALAFRGVEFVA